MQSTDTSSSSISRGQFISEFLSRHGWGEVLRRPISGDASFRRYWRLTRGDESTILMDAPPDREDVASFVHVDKFLCDSGFSAPRIIAEDREQGFLLLEDLGDDLFSQLLKRNPESEEKLYIAATQTLLALHKLTPPPGLPIYDESLLMQEVELFSDWYLPQILGEKPAASLREEFCKLWRESLCMIPSLPPVVVLRDFHADNLLWLPQREGVKRVGLLDFQDAVIGSPAYDIVSFIEDARRDVSQKTADAVIETYLSASGLVREEFTTSCAILAAQRNTKIIGIFTRLAVRDGKDGYTAMIPHVWKLLERDISHPQLAAIRKWLDDNIPRSLRNAPGITGK